MKKTKIDWCDSTINPVVGCPNCCLYCYARKLNTRFKWLEDWDKPQFFPERLKEFYSKKPKSIFIDSMSDIGTWKDEWLVEVLKAMCDNPQHRYIALTKTGTDNLLRKISNYCLLNGLNAQIGTLTFIGKSVATQKQVSHNLVNFLSVEPILEELDLSNFLDYCYECKTIIIGAETGNRKGKVIPKFSFTI